MGVVSKILNDGSLLLKNQVNERLPAITNGLTACYPFDGTLQKYVPYQIRYIRDWVTGNTVNNSNHWIEIQALDYNNNNVALNKTAYINGSPTSLCPALVDGSTDATQWGLSNMADGGTTSARVVDLGDLYTIKKIIVWHFYGDGRTYHNTLTEVSQDGILWHSIFDSVIEGEYVETSAGHTIDFTNLGLTCKPSVNTNSTLLNDGLYLEESTTNLFLYSNDFSNAVWNKGNAVVASDKHTITFTGQSYLYQRLTVFSPATQYTMSWKIRGAYEGQKIRISFESDGTGSIGVGYDVVTLSTTDKIFTKTITTSSSGGTYIQPLLYQFTGDNAGDKSSIYVSWAQLEQKSFNTAYVNSSRSAVWDLSIKMNTGTNFTIFYKYVPDIDWAPIFAKLSYMNKELWFLYDGLTNKKVWLYDYVDGTNGNTTTDPWIGFDEFVANTYSPWHWHHNAKHVAGKEYWFALTKNGAVWTKYMFTELGYSKMSATHTDPALIAFTPNKLEFRTSYNYCMKDLSIYNRALSESEIKGLYNTNIDIRSDGNMYNKIKEKTNKLPSGVYYFPLGYDSNDESKIYTSASSSGVLYDQNAVWIGLPINNKVNNPSGSISATAPGSYKPGWDNSLHSTALSVSSWSGGYNSGVPSPTIGYHAQWVLEGMDGPYDPCMKFIDRNDIYSLGHRWLGINESLGIPTALGWAVGTKLTISWYQKSDVLGKGARVGLYHKRLDNGIYDFETATNYITVTRLNSWERVSYTYTITSNWDLTADCSIYVYGHYGNYGTLWVDKAQVEVSSFLSPYVPTTNSSSILRYNFNSSIGLDWSGNWSIVYWKMPISTQSGNLTGYNIESLGCNSNSLGGGYIFWGKTTGSDAIYSSTPSLIDPTVYFGKWHLVSLVKSGTTLTIKEWIDGTPYVRTTTVNTAAANYYVNQYGYDFMFGWDNTNVSNTYYKDLIVAKRALTDTEINSMRQTPIFVGSKAVQLQNEIIEGYNL